MSFSTFIVHHISSNYLPSIPSHSAQSGIWTAPNWCTLHLHIIMDSNHWKSLPVLRNVSFRRWCKVRQLFKITHYLGIAPMVVKGGRQTSASERQPYLWPISRIRKLSDNNGQWCRVLTVTTTSRGVGGTGLVRLKDGRWDFAVCPGQRDIFLWIDFKVDEVVWSWIEICQRFVQG